jgi:hypothetical protein
MKSFAAALAATLIATPVLAQATPPAAGTSPSPSDNQSAATNTRDAGFRDTARSGRGAYIKLEGPQGGEITIRCADGETTRACADIAIQLMDRARSAGSDYRRDRDTRGGDYYRDRDRGRDY